ncbi:MAG TPA: LysR family transcriptional regulator [Bacilli bacterium]|nr:LysR family transcriptional regulator [Bacilli bacterium]
MDNFNLNLFKYFYYVVLYNGVTNASKNLSVAQPSLSLSIKNLEGQLQKTLIDRTSKQFMLTDEGEKLFELLKPFFENMEKNIDFSNNKNKYEVINIGIRYCYAKSILSNFITLYSQEHPKIKLNIDLYSKLNFEKVKNKEYDIVIDDYDYVSQLENISIENLISIKNYFICGNKYYNDFKDVRSISELDEAPFISYRPSLKTGKFRKLCYDNNVSFIELYNVNESDLYFDLLIKNSLIGFTNEILLKEYLNNNDINIIKVCEEIFNDQISLAISKRNKNIDEFSKMLISYINEVL